MEGFSPPPRAVSAVASGEGRKGEIEGVAEQKTLRPPLPLLTRRGRNTL